jgi:hypothetical protein
MDFCLVRTVLCVRCEGKEWTQAVFEILGVFGHHQVSVVGKKPAIACVGTSNIL